MSPRIITIIGSLNTDLVTTTTRVPAGGETLTGTSFSTGPGGKGANQAVACSRLSRSKPHSTSLQSPPTAQDVVVKMVGAVGTDEFGPRIISGMKADGIDISGIQEVEDETTGVAVIIVEESSGENRILLNPGANYKLLASDFTTIESLGSPLPDLIILQLEIPLETVLQILRTAKKAGVDVLLNPAPAVELPDEVFENLTHLIVNESEAAILSRRPVKEVEKDNFKWDVITDGFRSRGVKNVVVTLGAKGAFYGSEEASGFMPAEKVEKVVDTTAAGDTFVGAYAVNVVRGGSQLAEMVQVACRAAGKTVERKGAQSAIPWADET